MTLFAAGRYHDRIALTSQPYRFIERLVVLDSQKIDPLLVIPELSPNLGDGLRDQAAVVWDCEDAGLAATSIPSVNLTP